MASSRNDPWHVPIPDSRSDPANKRYVRSLRLSDFKRQVAMFATKKHWQSRLAYRRYCLEHWQDYLDGAIDHRAWKVADDDV